MQPVQKGQIGITIVSHWFLPYSNSKEDVEAVKRSLDFMYGWYVTDTLLLSSYVPVNINLYMLLTWIGLFVPIGFCVH